MVEISVIVPTLKEREDIECLRCLEQGNFSDYEVIVRNEQGVCRARNEGILRANADKLVFLDDDSRPQDNYLEKAASILDKESVVAGRIIHPRNDIIGRYFTDGYNHGSSPTYVDSFISCNMALRKEVFEAVGLFDEIFDWGHEETELADRVGEMFDIYYDPTLLVIHPKADGYIDFLVKRYRQETQRTHYWYLQDISIGGQLARTGYGLMRPSTYLGDTFTHTAAKTGVAFAASLGRLRGIAGSLFNDRIQRRTHRNHQNRIR